MRTKHPLVIFIIGVSGVGKSTIGNLLSKQLSIPFFDGDDFHSKKNKNKMATGQSLNDEDRYGWLLELNNLAKKQIQHNSCIIASSALKESYRDILKKDIEINVKWILLHGSFNQILDRIKQRKGHFMPTSLLNSQFETLEVPKEALPIDISNTPKKIITIIQNELLNKSEFGIIGLGVMGKSLSRNLASKGFTISIYNRHVLGLEESVALNFIKEFSELSDAMPFDNLRDFVNSLQRPRKIMLMVNAGEIIDLIIKKLIPYLSENDTIIDGGNSYYKDTHRRVGFLKKKNIHFLGAGISGGEEGALNGPSIMPGGDKTAYKIVKPFLEAIAAKDVKGNPCCNYMGKAGSGHFIKMIHNGIEYVEMQLLAEAYQILRSSGKNPDQIATILSSWKSEVDSYLLEITIDILKRKEGNKWLIDEILDKAGNKGTGNWATITTAELGVPSTLITSALFARYLSSYKEERIKINKEYISESKIKSNIDIEDLLKAYQLARLINHHQGFKLIYEASNSYGWELNLSEIARIWTNGCIIRSSLMSELSNVLEETNNIFFNKKIKSQIKELRPSLNKVVSQSILSQVPIPNLSEAVNFLNGYSEANSSANLIQAQRDYFGAHTYQRINDPSGKFYHTNWKSKSND
ncbi:MAG: decarboxylating NADP(+)-dependent phosphogluconate dehydrogenase [Bacteroidota bacterium]